MCLIYSTAVCSLVANFAVKVTKQRCLSLCHFVTDSPWHWSNIGGSLHFWCITPILTSICCQSPVKSCKKRSLWMYFPDLLCPARWILCSDACWSIRTQELIAQQIIEICLKYVTDKVWQRWQSQIGFVTLLSTLLSTLTWQLRHCTKVIQPVTLWQAVTSYWQLSHNLESQIQSMADSIISMPALPGCNSDQVTRFPRGSM